MKVYFLEISIYRLAKDNYSLEMDEYLEKRDVPKKEVTVDEILRVAKGGLSSGEQLNNLIRQDLIRSFGGGWRYNEIIGYLRFYQDGSRIKVAHWQHNAQRIRRTRKKSFIEKSHNIAETGIKNKLDSEEINKAIHYCLKQSIKRLNKKFHFDTENFDLMSNYTDWSYIFKSNA